MSQEPLARPVGVGARLPAEMLGGSEPALTGRPARFLILAADGNPELLGQGEHDIPDRTMAADVMVAVEMGRLPAEKSNEHGHLGAQFELYLFRLGLRGLPGGGARQNSPRGRQRGGLGMRVVLVRTPRRWASRMPRLTPAVRPKSSALTISRLTRAWSPAPRSARRSSAARSAAARPPRRGSGCGRGARIRSAERPGSPDPRCVASTPPPRA